GGRKVEEWDRMIDVNLKGVLCGIAAALPHMTRQKSGHIVNVSSVAGHKVRPGRCPRAPYGRRGGGGRPSGVGAAEGAGARPAPRACRRRAVQPSKQASRLCRLGKVVLRSLTLPC